MATREVNGMEIEILKHTKGDKVWYSFRAPDGANAKWVVGSGWEKVKYEMGWRLKATLKEQFPNLFK